MPVRSHRDLEVWKRAIELAGEVIRIARTLRGIETFALADQLRRSAMSVPANIAEGHGRRRRGAFLHHLSIARGSLAEVDSHMFLAETAGLLTIGQTQRAHALAEEVSRMLSGLERRVHASNPAH